LTERYFPDLARIQLKIPGSSSDPIDEIVLGSDWGSAVTTWTRTGGLDPALSEAFSEGPHASTRSRATGSPSESDGGERIGSRRYAQGIGGPPDSSRTLPVHLGPEASRACGRMPE
jgi:hypothetical protein